jgi:hypothetical protein
MTPITIMRAATPAAIPAAARTALLRDILRLLEKPHRAAANKRDSRVIAIGL